MCPIELIHLSFCPSLVFVNVGSQPIRLVHCFGPMVGQAHCFGPITGLDPLFWTLPSIDMVAWVGPISYLGRPVLPVGCGMWGDRMASVLLVRMKHGVQGPHSTHTWIGVMGTGSWFSMSGCWLAPFFAGIFKISWTIPGLGHCGHMIWYILNISDTIPSQDIVVTYIWYI